MAGPTTEVLNDDLKALREDFHTLSTEIREDFHNLSTEIREDNHRASMKVSEEIHRIDVEVNVLASKVGGILTLGKILLILTLTSLGSSIWWGATLTANARNLESKTDERFDAVDKRFDRLEASIAKVLEQTKVAPKP